MKPQSTDRENKAVIGPQEFAGLQLGLEPGQFRSSVADVTPLLREMEFPPGPEGKALKVQAARGGIVFVQSGIVSVSGTSRTHLRLLLSTRSPKAHEVTKGVPSLLVSGDARKDPLAIFEKKVEADPLPQATDIEQLGLSLSAAGEGDQQILYLFQIYRLALNEAVSLRSKTDDAVELVHLGEANRQIQLPMEQAILEHLRAILSQ